MICNLTGNSRASKNKKRNVTAKRNKGKGSSPQSLSLKNLIFVLIPAVTRNKWSMSGLVGNDGLWWFSGKWWIGSGKERSGD